MYSIYILVTVALFSVLYLIVDYRGPKYIILRSSYAFNLKCLRAKELIVQETDNEGSLWASRGLILYRMVQGENRFVKVAHIPTGISYFWLNNFTMFRRFTNKAECVEVTITGKGDICALSAGYMWHKPIIGGRFKRTMRLPFYGMGVGRGIFSNGILSVGNNQVYWGEYHRNTDRKSVRIYRSNDSGETWEVAYEYEPGLIRHVHSIQQDPFTNKLWVCTGDDDNEAMIGWSDDGLNTIHQIGKGSQVWRTCQLVFTEYAIYWGTDTGSVELAGIYRWDKSTEEMGKLKESKGAILYGTCLDQGTIIFSVDREGFPNETDMKTRLFAFQEEQKITEIKCGTWEHWEKGFRYSFATLRIQRSKGYSSLVASIINQKEFPNGELLMIKEEELCDTNV